MRTVVHTARKSPRPPRAPDPPLLAHQQWIRARLTSEYRQQAGTGRQQRLQILGMQAPICADLPPYELRTHLLEYKPGGDVCFVSRSVTTISLRAPSVCPTARLISRMKEVAFMPNAISSVRRALTNAATLARAPSDRGVHCHALRVAPSPLHVVSDQVMIHRIQHDLRYLCARSVVEKMELPACFSAGNCSRRLPQESSSSYTLVQRIGAIILDGCARPGEIRPAALALGRPGPSGGPGPRGTRPGDQQGLDQRIHVLFAVVEVKRRAQVVVTEDVTISCCVSLPRAALPGLP